MLAAGALVASIFAVGAAPAAAQDAIDETDLSEVSAFSNATSCLGPALKDAEFTDVAMGSAHYNAINCIAHYGITAGKGDGTFGASDSVTRSQMALFLSGMSTLAGLTLDDAMDAGFTDLADTAANRVNAINRLVNGDIMTGTSDDTFSPEAAVTRAEMALWLVNFMVAATNATSPYNVERQRSGEYTITGVATFDFFPDARATQPRHVDSAISAAFELGITAGYGDNEFKGHRTVTRAEMATFITSTLSHTNVRPAGLTAQHVVTGTGAARTAAIQVSLRSANFAPVANEPIDLFRSYYPDFAFRADGTCDPRYVDGVEPSISTCEIDRGDTTTEADGNKNYTADDLRASGEGTVTCGTTAALRFAEAAESDTVFWVWTGALEDTVDADTKLVPVEGVPDADRMGGQQPHHANVSGGLDRRPSANQLEAKMGTNVRFTLQLHANPDDNRGDHAVPTAPDSSGNKYNVVVTVRKLEADGGGDFANAAARNAVRVVNENTYDPGDIISRERSVRSPDASGMLPIDVTYRDPDRARDNDDVVVTVELTAYQVDATAADYNKIDEFDTGTDSGTTNFVTTDVDNDGRTEGFEARVIFSDARSNPNMFRISADAPVYRLARVTGPASSYVDISAIDQYGNPVRGLSVNAISNQNGTGGLGTSVFPFVQYFTTGSNGSYRVQYSYTGSQLVETLTAFAAVPVDHDNDAATPMQLPERDTTPGNNVLEEPAAGSIWNNLLPAGLPGNDTVANRNTNSWVDAVYWVAIGQQSTSPSSGAASGYTYDADADTGLLAWDVSDKAFVVAQAEISGPPLVSAGPRVYYWDSHDTFQITDTTSATVSVSMELFEEVISATRRSVNAVTLGTLSWTSYNYNRPNDRAHWVLSCVGP